ncbi:MAG: hypothetical protein GXP10_11465 [Gammaproteobacteria bacterium]|nr:hypothetical protein [Gammaproteobacteria bacterium]
MAQSSVNPLTRIDFDLSFPFDVELSGVSDGSDDESVRVLTCISAARILPGRRLVCRAHWNGQNVFAKIFSYEEKARRDWQRELDGVHSLTTHKILTPKLLHSGVCADGAARVLIFAAIEPAQTVAQAWQALSEEKNAREESNEHAQRQFMTDLVALFAQHHQAGILHQDPHLNNFLVSGGRLYTLDGGDVSLASEPVPRKVSRDNLALLFAQFYPRYEPLIYQSYSDYLRARRWPSTDEDVEKLSASIDEQRSQRLRRYLNKIFRSCSAFVCQESRSKTVIYDRRYESEAFSQLLDDPDRWLTDGGQLLKRGNSSTVGVAEVNGKRLVIKRYNIKDFRHGLKRALRTTRAATSWRGAHMLSSYGIATAPPVALIERHWGPIKRVSYFISEYVEGAASDQFFFSKKIDLESKQRVADEVVALFRDLKRFKIGHGDMKASNIIISDGGRPVLNDLDAMKQYRTANAINEVHQRDLSRFLENWKAEPRILALFAELSLSL